MSVSLAHKTGYWPVKLHWKTALSDRLLDCLLLLGLADKQPDGRVMRYRLSSLGRVYANGGPDDALFAYSLRSWSPYRAMCAAINEKGVAPQTNDVISYFRRQYAPYTPYAKSLFNPNKTDGLLRLYKTFGG